VTSSEAGKALLAAPQELARLLKTAKDPVRKAVRDLAGRRLWLLGSGTSLHAALAAEQLFRPEGLPEARALGTFEFTRYTPPLRSTDAVLLVTHSGGKHLTREAARLARSACAKLIAVTGIGARFEEADHVLETVPQERSQAHTVSLLGAMTVLGLAVLELGRLVGRPEPPWAGDVERTPDLLQGILDREEMVRRAAEEAVGARQVFFVGGGPAWPCALEGALKVQEMAHRPALTVELEAALHGPLVSLEPGDRVVLLAPAGAGSSRAQDLARAVREIGAGVWTVGPDGFDLGPAHELWAPVPCAAALQLFALRLGLLRGSSPDTNRRDEEPYDRAFKSYAA